MIKQAYNANKFIEYSNTKQQTKIDVNVNIHGDTATTQVLMDNKTIKRKDVRLNAGSSMYIPVS